MKNFLLTFTCYTITIPVVISQRYLLPVLDTAARYLWSLLVEPEQAPTLAAVVPLPVTPVPSVQPDEAAPVKAAVKRTRKTSTTKATTPRTTRRRKSQVTQLGDATSKTLGSTEVSATGA